MPTDILRRQKWRIAQFHCQHVYTQLEFLEDSLSYTVARLLRLPCFSIPPVPLQYFALDRIEQTQRIVCREQFDPTNSTHLSILYGYVGARGQEAAQDRILLAREACEEELIDRWQSWGAIEKRLGFQLPFEGVWGLPQPQQIPFVRALWHETWAVIRAAAPKEVGRKWNAGTAESMGSGFHP